MAKNRDIVPKFKALTCFGSMSVLVLLLSACSTINEKELQGTYVAQYPFGTETCILNVNGEYIQEVVIKGETKDKPIILKHRGHWWYEPKQMYVRLENALYIDEDSVGVLRKDYNLPVDGDVLMKVRRTFPSIRLGTAYEDIDYVKMK